LQKHGGRLDKGEQYCGTCYGAEEVCAPFCKFCYFAPFYLIVTSISAFLIHILFSYLLTLFCLHLFGVQSDEQCCNSCEEVREAYKKKGWALTNPDLIDQVYQLYLPGFIHQ